MTDTARDLGDLLSRGADRWRARLLEGCAVAGFRDVTVTTCQVLRPLFDHDGLPISEVGARAGLAKSTMTTVVQQLVREGLVRIEGDGDDHRVKRMYLTPRARELERAIGEGLTRLRHRVTASLGPQGQQQLHRTLQRIIDTL